MAAFRGPRVVRLACLGLFVLVLMSPALGAAYEEPPAPRNEPPVAVPAYSPWYPLIETLIGFDATYSHDPDGTIVAYEWDLGDGTVVREAAFSYSYAVLGNFTVTLVVTDDQGATGRALTYVEVGAAVPLPPPASFTRITHASGYAVAVPPSWEVQRDQVFEGTRIDLILLGGVTGSFRTNVVIVSGPDGTVRETAPYLRSSAENSIQDARTTDPGAYIDGPLVFLNVTGHLGILYDIRYPAQPFRQRVVLLVSEVHGYFWVFVFSADAFAFPGEAFLLDYILGGFEITPSFRPASLIGGLSILLALILALVVAGGIGGIFVARSARRFRLYHPASPPPPRKSARRRAREVPPRVSGYRSSSIRAAPAAARPPPDSGSSPGAAEPLSEASGVPPRESSDDPICPACGARSRWSRYCPSCRATRPLPPP